MQEYDSDKIDSASLFSGSISVVGNSGNSTLCCMEFVEKIVIYIFPLKCKCFFLLNEDKRGEGERERFTRGFEPMLSSLSSTYAKSSFTE